MQEVFVVLVVLVMVGVSLLRRLTGTPNSTQSARERQAMLELAEALGLPEPSKHRSDLRGTIDGVPISINRVPSGLKVEADLVTGEPSFTIKRRRQSSASELDSFETGNPAFDSTFWVRADRDAESLARYLTPLRQDTLLALEEVFDLDEFEEDEIELRLRHEGWDVVDVVAAVAMVVRAAGVLGSSTPQDVVRERPQDRVR